MWNGAAEALNPSPAISIASPKSKSASCPRRAVDECGPEEQYGGTEAADDEVLEARLEPGEAVAIDAAEDVEADREPFESQEERHQVVRPGEERHPGACRCEQRVVLRNVFVARALAIRDCRREQARPSDDDPGQLGEAIAADRIGDDAVSLRRPDVERDREAEGNRVPERAEDGSGGLPRRARDEDRAQQRERRGSKERVDGREC